MLEPRAADLGVEVKQQDIFRVCDQLGQQKLLNWKVEKSTLFGIESIFRSGLGGKISAFGVDVVEGNKIPAIKVEFVQHTNTTATKVKFVQHTNNSTVNITGSTNVIAGNSITGDNNTLTLSGLEKAIESADATPQAKEEAKTLLRKLSEHPLVSAIIGGAVGLLGS